MSLTIEERIQIILLCGQIGATNRSVAESFNSSHERVNISHTTVGRLLTKFKETGSVHDRERSGRPTIAIENREVIINKIIQSPKKSVRRSSREISIPRSTIQKVLNAEHFHPYKIQILHKLYEDDPDRRLEMAMWFKDQLAEDPEMVHKKICFSDEANFYLNGEVNRQNCRYYARENPNWMHSTKEHSVAKMMVWCGLWRDHVLGPSFFNSMVTGENYLQMLKEDFIPQLNFIGEGRPDYFMQDGAPSHYAAAVRHWLDENFEHWIGRRGTIEWAPRSPDLNPMDYYFWGHLKQLVYAVRIEDIDHLRSRIRDACQKINGDQQLLNRVYNNFHHRIDLCMTSSGEHFEHL